jgi:methionine synthase II (cobalamin-independent)
MSLELDEELRKVVSELNDGKYHRGDLKKAVEEAVKDWIRKKRQEGK